MYTDRRSGRAAEPGRGSLSTPTAGPGAGHGAATPAGDDGSVVALSGRSNAEISLQAIRDGELALADLRIHPDQLEHQAKVAESFGNPQLAENLRRAAELTAVDDDEVLAIYDALRPGRRTPGQLRDLATSLEGRGLRRCAALILEASVIYERRGLSA
jgi:propanediol dehydratase small subunit